MRLVCWGQMVVNYVCVIQSDVYIDVEIVLKIILFIYIFIYWCFIFIVVFFFEIYRGMKRFLQFYMCGDVIYY